MNEKIMNEEIKEILDRIETASEIFDCLLQPEECTALLNYITNLQNRITELEEINRDHQRMNIELREENKRLKKYLDDKMKDLQNIYTQYIRLQNTYEDLYDKYIDIVEGRNENE